MTVRYLNGRAAVNGPGGFARFHDEVTAHLRSNGPITVLAPPRSDPLSSRWWEQRTLVGRSGDGVLLSTANNGPVGHPNHAVVIHDILPLTHPETVSPVFAALQRVLLPRLCRNAAAVLTVSNHVAGQLETVLGVDPERITVVPPGVSDVFRPAADGGARNGDARSSDARSSDARNGYDGDDRDGGNTAASFGLDPDRPVVTALVSSIPRKNSTEVLGTLAAVAATRSDVQVVVAGHDGPTRVFGRRAVRPTHPAVRDLGPLPDERLADLFRRADVFVSLTEAEGFGLPPLEALAAGAAVVTTPMPSLAEHFPGLTATVTDRRAAATAVIDLLGDSAARAAQVTAAADVVEDLTWAGTAAAVGQVLRRLESRGRLEPPGGLEPLGGLEPPGRLERYGN
ncbi:MAG: glycosyltransferase [Actinomycetota bacterium]